MQMEGLPAGLEDENSDSDEFMMYDEDVEEFYTPDIKPKLYNQHNHESHRINSSFDASKLEHMKQSFSLLTEDMKVAIIQNNVEKMRKCLDNGYQIDSTVHSGWTALMVAGSLGSSDIVKDLIEKKANVNFECDLFTPLMAACYPFKENEDNLLDCVRSLIASGAKVNAHDRNLMTPLMYASKQGYSKLVRYLCENEADVNKQETRGWTALCFGAFKGYVHIVKILASYGADIDLAAFDGQKACDIAFSQGYKMLSELLEEWDRSKLQKLNELPDQLTSLTSSGTSRYVKYGDMELFLHGLELGYLIPKFQEHQLDLSNVLKLSDKEMLEIGIKEIGVRKKLLSAIRDVHTNEWDMDYFKNLEKINKLTILELAAVVANASKHLACIDSSIHFVKENIKQKKDILAKDDPSNKKILVDQIREAVNLTSALQGSITSLNTYTLKVFPDYNQKPINLIEIPEEKTSPRVKPLVSLSLVAISGISIYFGIKYYRGYMT